MSKNESRQFDQAWLFIVLQFLRVPFGVTARKMNALHLVNHRKADVIMSKKKKFLESQALQWLIVISEYVFEGDCLLIGDDLHF